MVPTWPASNRPGVPPAIRPVPSVPVTSITPAMFWPTESWPGPTVSVLRLPPTVTVAVVVIEPNTSIERAQVADGHDIAREVLRPAGSVAGCRRRSRDSMRGRERDPLGQRAADPRRSRGPRRPGRGTRDAREGQVDVEVHADEEIVDLLPAVMLEPASTEPPTARTGSRRDGGAESIKSDPSNSPATLRIDPVRRGAVGERFERQRAVEVVGPVGRRRCRSSTGPPCDRWSSRGGCW